MKKEMIQKEPTLKGSNLWGVLVFAILLLIDMVTKIVADAYFSQPDAPDKIALIEGYLEFCIARNRGISFSLGSTAPMEAKIALVASTGVLFVVFATVYFKADKRRTWLRWALVFIVAGGVGNLIDRAYYQVWDPNTYPAGVRDMVRLKIFMFDFGVCNFADFFIVGGAIALMLSVLFFDGGAIFPLTKKYKALSKEYEERDEAKKAEKTRKKAEAKKKE